VAAGIEYVLDADRKEVLSHAANLSIAWVGVASAQSSMVIDPSGSAFAVPFREKVDDTQIVTAQFLPGYKGFVVSAERVGRRLFAHVIRDGDILNGRPVTAGRLGLSTSQIPDHVAYPSGNIVGAYSVLLENFHGQPFVRTLLYDLNALDQVRFGTRRGKESPAWKWHDGAAMYKKIPLARQAVEAQISHALTVAAEHHSAIQGGLTHTAHQKLLGWATSEGIEMPAPYTDEDYLLAEHMADTPDQFLDYDDLDADRPNDDGSPAPKYGPEEMAAHRPKHPQASWT
jgi:hypothetical protein